MSLPLIIKSKLFWRYNGVLDCCWYLGCGDNTSVTKQDNYLRDMGRFGVNTATLNLLNEGCSTIFSGEFMNSPIHEGKVNMYCNFIRRLKDAGEYVFPVVFDCPRESHPKYPFWKFTDRLGPFLEVVTTALDPLVDGFILGIETSRSPTITAKRGLSLPEVEACIGLIKKHTKKPVGIHECSYRVPANADFLGYETRNHPVNQGDSTSIADMVKDVQGLISVSKGKPIWIIESNSSEGAQAKAQNRALAALNGVIGVNMPI
jgi:hypothetical protein